jgi:hypothetical protein
MNANKIFNLSKFVALFFFASENRLQATLQSRMACNILHVGDLHNSSSIQGSSHSNQLHHHGYRRNLAKNIGGAKSTMGIGLLNYEGANLKRGERLV